MSSTKHFIIGYMIAGISFVLTIVMHSALLFSYDRYADFLQLTAFSVISASLADFRIWELLKSLLTQKVGLLSVIAIDFFCAIISVCVFACITIVFRSDLIQDDIFYLVMIPLAGYFTVGTLSQIYRIDYVEHAMQTEQSLTCLSKIIIILLAMQIDSINPTILTLIFFIPFSISYIIFTFRSFNDDFFSGKNSTYDIVRLVRLNKWFYGSLKALLLRIDSLILPGTLGSSDYALYRGLLEIIISIASTTKPIGNKIYNLLRNSQIWISSMYAIISLLLLGLGSYVYFAFFRTELDGVNFSPSFLTCLCLAMSISYIYSIHFRVKLTEKKLESYQNFFYTMQLLGLCLCYLVIENISILLLLTLVSIALTNLPVLLFQPWSKKNATT